MKKHTEMSYGTDPHSLQSYQTEISENDRVHFPYEFEETFFQAVREGNSGKVYGLLRQMLGLPEGSREDILRQIRNMALTSAGIMSRQRQKQAEYSVVLTVSLIARAAISGGLDPYLAYDINDLYLQKISETEDIEAYWRILLDALDTYLKEMEKLRSAQNQSRHVLHARQYIGKNLNKALSLPEIAAATGLSPSYLSALFTKTEGIGIKEYIIRQRIEAAKNLLLYSDADIGMISNYVGFCSQSHFGKLFRERCGMTPHQFRSGRKG